MDIIVEPKGWLIAGSTHYRCSLGRAGIVTDQREGDGATPSGVFPLRRLLFRQTRISDPKTKLPRQALEKYDGWCDSPEGRTLMTSAAISVGWAGGNLIF